MNLLLIWWQRWRLDAEEEELHDRCVNGTCSDVWAARVMRMTEWRRYEIRRLRAECLTLRLVARWVS